MTNVLLAVTSAVAWIWNRRAGIIETAGAVCLVAAAAMFATWAALTVAGVALVLKAAEIDRSNR